MTSEIQGTREKIAVGLKINFCSEFQIAHVSSCSLTPFGIVINTDNYHQQLSHVFFKENTVLEIIYNIN